MNNRIKQLASKYIMHERFTRYGESIEEDYYEFYLDELQEFVAEIVKECADLCDRFQARDVGMQPAECAVAIRSMFGVEK